MSKVCIEHEAWTVSGKRTAANLFDIRRNGSKFFIYLFILSFRVTLFTWPSTYLRWAVLIMPFLIAVLNWFSIQCCHLLGSDRRKNVLTAITAIFIPVCFVAKREVQNMRKPELRFAKFYLYNNIYFSISSLLVLVATNLVLHFDVLPDFYMSSCAGMPFTECHQTWSDALNGGKYSNHVIFFFYGNPLLIAVILLHTALSFYFSSHCQNKIYQEN